MNTNLKLQDNLTPASAEANAFASCLAKLVETQGALNFLKKDSKAAQDAVNAASRVAAWAAFELMLTTDDHKTEGGSLALQIADARGIEGKSRDVYAQRGRDMATFAGKIKLADRTKADPLTLAKKLRQTKDTKTTETARDAIYMHEAREMAMGALEITPAEFDAELIAVDGQDTREALSNALELCRKRGEVLNTIRDAMTVLAAADNATKEAAKVIFAAFA